MHAVIMRFCESCVVSEGKEEWSWRVVAGQNAAYDQFPCQYQIFYRGKAKRSMWYDPVFQVSAPLLCHDNPCWLLQRGSDMVLQRT